MMPFNFNYGFSPEQLNKLMTQPTSPPTGIETMADEVGMGDFTAEVPVPPVPENVDYSGFNPWNPTGVPVPPVPPVPVPPVPPVPENGDYSGFNPWNPGYNGPWTGVDPIVTDPVVDPVANLTPMPPGDTNVKVPTNYPSPPPGTGKAPTTPPWSGAKFDRMFKPPTDPTGPFERPADFHLPKTWNKKNEL